MKLNDKTKKDLYNTAIISLGLIISFSLGYFTANTIKVQKPPLRVESQHLNQDKGAGQANHILGNEKNQGQVVASVNSDKYHYLNCPGAKMIKEENKIFFADAQEAENAGLTLAGNCN